MLMGLKVAEWDGYVCQMEAKGFTLPQSVVVKILDLPASEEDKRKRVEKLSVKPQYGPPAIEFLREEADGWYLDLPYPESLVAQAEDSIYAEGAVLIRWFGQGIGVSVELA